MSIFVGANQLIFGFYRLHNICFTNKYYQKWYSYHVQGWKNYFFCFNYNYQGFHAFINKKFQTFSIPKFAQNKLSFSHLKYTKLQLF